RIFIPSLVAESGNVDHRAGPAPPWFERRIRRRARRRAGPPAAFAVVLLQETVLRATRNSVPQRRAAASRTVLCSPLRRARPRTGSVLPTHPTSTSACLRVPARVRRQASSCTRRMDGGRLKLAV